VAFPTKLLIDGEELVLDLRPHWWFFAGPASVLGVALVVLIWVAAVGIDWLVYAVATLAVVALFWFIGRFARWGTVNFVVTTDRIIYRSGVVAKQGIEIPLERVNTIFSHQGIIERLLRSGDLVIESGGEHGRQKFADIRNPLEVQSEIYRQIEDNQNRMYGGMRARNLGEVASPPDVLGQLEKLDELRRRGVLTEAEFQATKAQLLDRM
jgi:membrane protein YdbS with pleckstrin-like domain